MTLIIDDRESASLAGHIGAHGVDTAISHLDYGDICWSGNGPSGEVTIGVERKRLDMGSQDLVASLLDNRLIGHQIKGMRSAYDHVALLVEGNFRCGDSGEIEVLGREGWQPLFHRRRGINYRQIDGFLASLEYSGVAIWRAQDERQSAAILASRYMWWQKKFTDHHSMEVIYSPGPGVSRRGGKAMVMTGKPTLAQMWASDIPGLDRRAWEIGKKFETGIALANASADQWRTALGMGKKAKTPDDIWQAIRSSR